MNGSAAEPAVAPDQDVTDVTGRALQKIAQWAVFALFGLLPIFFIPGLFATLGFSKVLLALIVIGIVVITTSLLSLRRRQIQTVLPLALGSFWLLVIAAMASGLLSGDVQDAIRGTTLETQTAGFLAVLALTMTIPLVLQGSKQMTIRSLAFFGVTSVLLLLYVLLRFVMGSDFLQFDSFTAVTATPLGGFNDLALFSGLLVLFGLVTLSQLPMRTWMQAVFTVVIVAALLVLAVVNFFGVWVAVGFFALLLLVYLLSRDVLFKTAAENRESSRASGLLLGTTVLVCLVSGVFIAAGEYAGNKISDWAGINYVEVRPSIEATIGIGREVYSENALFGIGTNRFADAWRLHKDQSINNTVFWETDFNAGSGFVPTLFVNTGILGGVLLVAFHLLFLYVGYRMLLRTKQPDSYWYYFGAVSFTTAVFVWVMSYVYVPGAAILLLGALFTGGTFVAAGSLLPALPRTVPLAVNQRRGFLLMAAIILLITATVATLFSVGTQYHAAAQFTKAQAAANSLEQFGEVAKETYELYEDDRFLSAYVQTQLARLNALLAKSEPTEADQQQFLATAEQALVAAERAVSEDPTNPDNHALLAAVYSNLALAGVEGASERVSASLNRAAALDPQNPGYHLLAAQLATRTGDLEKAREEIEAALALKRNYTEALYLSTQLDISEGNTASAIATTRSIITLEPRNPTRHFQLGVLLSADEQLPQAIEAFERAIALDPSYANARYLLALVHLNNEEQAAALAQLRVVAETNQDNQQLLQLIQQIEDGEAVTIPDLGIEIPVTEAAPVEDFEDTITTDGTVNTDLLAPVNAVPEEAEVSETESGRVAEVVTEAVEVETEEAATGSAATAGTGE